MHTITISSSDTFYPAKVKKWFADQPIPPLHTNGNLEILHSKKSTITALFSSRNCPGTLLLPTMDMATILRDNDQTVISGFHSPLEQECLQILLRGSQPIIICPARSIHTMRVVASWKQPIKDNRILVLSQFSKEKQRIIETLSRERNQLVAALADEILIIYAPQASKISTLATIAIKHNKKVFALDAPENEHLFQLGVLPWIAETTGNSVKKLSDLL